jgi:hypothetical protein
VLLATRHSACRAKVSAINQLKALIVGAPEELRAELRGLGTKRQIARYAGLRERPTRSLEHRMTARTLRCTARRIQLLAAEAAGLRAELERLVAAVAPWPAPIRSWRPSKGKSTREIRRCLKRAVARQLFKLLERYDPAQVRPATVV